MWVGSSLPVRDLDRFGATRSHAPRILANRGASGIDGILSSAAGAASVTPGRTIALVGDLTFQHDLTGLAAAAHHAPNLTIVVIDNHGGGIFEHLPIAAHEPPFEELFATPQTINLEHAVRAFNLPYQALQPNQLKDALATKSPGILHIAFDRKQAAQTRKTIQKTTIQAVEEALRNPETTPPLKEST